MCIHSYFTVYVCIYAYIVISLIHIILMCTKVLGSYFSKLEWNSVVSYKWSQVI